MCLPWDTSAFTLYHNELTIRMILCLHSYHQWNKFQFKLEFWTEINNVWANKLNVLFRGEKNYRSVNIFKLILQNNHVRDKYRTKCLSFIQHTHTHTHMYARTQTIYLLIKLSLQMINMSIWGTYISGLLKILTDLGKSIINGDGDWTSGAASLMIISLGSTSLKYHYQNAGT